MNKLIKIENNNDLGLVVSSRTVAEELGRQHKHVLESIYKLINDSTADISALFILSEYQAANGKMNKEYLLTKDGFTLYMFNIQGHNNFKMSYINRFNEMEQVIKENKIELPSNPMDVLKLMFDAQEDTNKKVSEIESDVVDLKENRKIEPSEYNYLNKRVQAKIRETIKKFGYSESQEVKKQLNRNISIDINSVANVSTRAQIKMKDYESVLEFIRTWEPSSAVQHKLRQLEFELRQGGVEYVSNN